MLELLQTLMDGTDQVAWLIARLWRQPGENLELAEGSASPFTTFHEIERSDR